MSFQLMTWASRQTTGSATRKAVLLALANRANHDTGACCPSAKTIADETELSERTVLRALDDLVDQGLITRTRRRRKDGSLGVYDYEFPHDTDDKPHDAVAARPPARVSGRNQEVPEPGTATTDVVAVGDGDQAPAMQQVDGRNLAFDALQKTCGIQAPAMQQVDGRNLAFDALQKTCGIQNGSPRMIEVATALNGTRRNGGEDGIRVMAWRELRDDVGMVGDGPALEHAIAALIVARAAQYRRVFGAETTLTPLALRKWFVDLPALEERAGGRAVDAAQIAAAELRRMEGS